MQETVDQFWDSRGIVPRHLIASGAISEEVSLNLLNHPSSIKIIQKNWRRHYFCSRINKRVKEKQIAKQQALQMLKTNQADKKKRRKSILKTSGTSKDRQKQIDNTSKQLAHFRNGEEA